MKWPEQWAWKQWEKGVIINNKRLTIGQVMALRIAISRFWEDMKEPGALGDDEFGAKMADAYRARAEEVLKLLLEEPT